VSFIHQITEFSDEDDEDTEHDFGGALEKCDSLLHVDLSRCLKITEISAQAFEECRYLKTAILPPFLKRIEFNSFRKCTALEEISSPNLSTFSTA